MLVASPCQEHQPTRRKSIQNEAVGWSCGEAARKKQRRKKQEVGNEEKEAETMGFFARQDEHGGQKPPISRRF